MPVSSSSEGPRLGEIEPRERAGAQTGRKYEYQYERTARAALDLLTDTAKHVCVYCDWHDDYVIETGDPPTRYMFHQVKGRTSSQGPWTFNEFFGAPMKKTNSPSKKPAMKKPAKKKKPAKVNETAIVPRMLLHYANFGHNCAGIAFVTNAGLDPALSGFLETVARSANVNALPPDARIAFDHIASAYGGTDPPLAASAGDLFAWVRGLKVYTDQGHIDSADAALLEIAAVVFEYSEIELGQRQAKQIAREIVSEVRGKVGHRTTIVPTSDEQLRRDKGIVVSELLNVLSLSAQAYEALRAGAGSDAVKTLSRLQRFCEKHDMHKFLVPISQFKALWDIWRTIERHNVSSMDFLLLENRANEVLKGKLTLERVVAEAKDIAKQFAGVGVTPLTPEDVMGLIFSMAAQSEALS
ncbi:MAG: dsDNA nuclease domain-containing protein [Candidatus Sulfotelmatobacter sp.]